MATVIKSGQDGNTAIVDDFKDLHTFATIRTESAVNTLEGNTFWTASGFISLTTTGSFSGIYYLKNTHLTKEFHVEFLRTCGLAAAEWKLYRNPTTGTLISGGTDVVPGNANFSSGGVLTATVKGGADAQTVTDGNVIAQWINGAGHSVQEFKGSMVLGPGDSLALTCKPESAADVCVTLMGWQASSR